MSESRYGTLDGLRTIACLGIVLMHMATNNMYSIEAKWYTCVVPSFTDFVFLFMVISAFAMCCGYLKKIQEGIITPKEFYFRRYQKVLPFFSLLVLIDILFNYQEGTLQEAFADLTLFYGLFPNDISVIGVGWFLGLVFTFYFLFPFYSVLLTSKISAIISFATAVAFSIKCGAYFGIGRNNIAYSFCFFLLGGVIYLCRGTIEKIPVGIVVVTAVACVYFYYSGKLGEILSNILVSGILVCFAVALDKSKLSWLLNNRLFSFISRISLEIYLSHMLVFRLVEKVGLNQLVTDSYIQYALTCALVITGSVFFSFSVKKMMDRAFKKSELVGE